MAKALRVALAVVVALAAVVGVLLFVQSRDKSQVDSATASAPGRLLPDQGADHHPAPAGFRYATDPPTSGPHVPAAIARDRAPLTDDQLLNGLELGDVVLVYAGHQGQEDVLRRLQEDVSGP